MRRTITRKAAREACDVSGRAQSANTTPGQFLPMKSWYGPLQRFWRSGGTMGMQSMVVPGAGQTHAFFVHAAEPFDEQVHVLQPSSQVSPD